jgi:hypothetical protein
MNRLQAEQQRLSLATAAPPQAGSAAHVLVLELSGPAPWERLAAVWQGVQADLDLPAPAIAVSGRDGYQLWFPLAEPLPLAQATAFLQALRSRYLAGVPADRIRCAPPEHFAAPPTQAASELWSAFVTADLAALFADTPWLDLPPSVDAQADLLSRVQRIETPHLQRALQRLAPPAAAPSTQKAGTAAGEQTADPRRFLLQVMNDAAVDMHLRIEAAKALLPYSERQGPT